MMIVALVKSLMMPVVASVDLSHFLCPAELKQKLDQLQYSNVVIVLLWSLGPTH